MSIRYKENSGKYEARYRDPNGRRKGKTFDTKQAARNFLKTIQADVLRGDYIDPQLGKTLFRDMAGKWFETTTHLKPKTRAGYESILRTHVLPRFGDTPIKNISRSDVRAFISDLQASGAQPGTTHNAYRVLTPIFRMAVEDGLLKANPCVGIKMPRAHHQEMHFLTAEQVTLLAHELSDPYGTLVTFAAYTGMRAGEIAALRVKHLDLLRRTVDVVESVADVNGRLTTGPTKSYNRRTVALPPFLVDLLASHLQDRPHEPQDYVFPNTQGGQLRHGNFYRRQYKPAVRRALPSRLHSLRFHDLRHTCAAFLIDSGAHPKDICDWLGHSSITVTMDKYGHRFPERNAELAGFLQSRHETVSPAPTSKGGEVVGLRR